MSPARPTPPPSLPAFLVARGWLDPEALAHAERRAGMGASDTTIVEALLATGQIATTHVAAARRELAGTPVEHLGRHAALSVLGRGGMGEVLAVRDPSLGRIVAAKRLHPGADVVQRAKFMREARITGALEHPGIVPVHELDEGASGNAPYFTMKRVDGHDLDAHIAERDHGTVSLVELLGAFAKVCDAVGYAHAHGVVHRDLKPANILIGRFGEVYVCDWGLAKSVDAVERPSTAGAIEAGGDDDPLATLDGTVMGTPAYMSPEQAEGRILEVDDRSDIYSLGAILYQILCGVPPYVGGTAFDVLAQVATGPPAPPSKRAAHATRIPWELEAVCLRAMARNPGARYASATELRRDVESYLTGGVLEAARYSPLQRLAKWTWRNRAITFPALAVLTCLAALGVGARFVRAGRLRATMAEGHALLDKGRAEDAAERYARALIMAPLDPEATLARERALARIRHDQARALLAKASALAIPAALADAPPRDARATEQALEAHLAATSLLEQACALAPEDAEIAAQRHAAGVALARLATDSGDYTVARHAIRDLGRHGWAPSEVEREISRIEQRRNARRDEERRRLETILTDFGAGLSRAGRDPSAPTIDDYVLESASIRDPQTVEILARAIAPLLEADPRATRTARDTDLLRFAMRVFGRLRMVEAIAPLAACACKLNEVHLMIEAGRALCDTHLADARAPLRLLEQRLGSENAAWIEVSQWLDRLPAPTATDSEDAVALFTRAAAHLDRGDAASAIAAFSEYLSRFPNEPGALVNRAIAYFDSQDNARAQADIAKALELDPRRAAAFHVRARIHERSRELPLALADFTRAIELDPAQVAYRINRGGFLQTLGQHDQALEDFQFILDRHPHLVTALVGRARCAIALGRLADARADLDRALALDPSSALVHATLGRLYLQQSDHASAEQHLSRALELGATTPSVRLLLASAMFARGDLVGARAALAQARDEHGSLDVESTALRAHVELGLGEIARALASTEELLQRAPSAPYHGLHAWILLRLGREADARAAADRALGLDPRDTSARLVRATYHERAKEFREAESDLTVALAGNSDAATFAARSRCRKALGDYAGALADAERALQGNPELAEAHAAQGAALTKLGRSDDALAALDRALELDPTLIDARLHRSQLRQARGQMRAALADLDYVVERAPRYVPARGVRGLLRRDLGDRPGAIEDFRAVLEQDATDWRAHFNLAMSLSLDGKRDEALASMRRALELAPEERRADVQQGLDQLENK